MYHEARLRRGNAISRAPTIRGTRKLPSTDGIDGIRKNQTMTTPWIVNNLLYVSELTTSAVGVISSSLISAAATAPIIKNPVIETRYSSAMRLWSCVVTHD